MDELNGLRVAVQAVDDVDFRDFLTVALAGSIRRVSLASERAGRIFKDTGKRPECAWDVMKRRVGRMIDGMKEYESLRATGGCELYQSDARHTSLPSETFGMVFFHPPYFALYKYSSDVLRFELDWLGFDRKQIASLEIRDGFKTTKKEDLNGYLEDLGAVLSEARRVVAGDGVLVLVCGDSTLRKESLDVVDKLVDLAESKGFSIARHCIREVRFSQASYHRSADADIRTPRDHIIFLRPG